MNNQIKKTAVFETFWKFASKRQEIFFNRLSNKKKPWCGDEILNTYKFTNVYRASDRVSQYLIKHIIYNGDQSPKEILFRILLFKLFNKIDTWQLFLNSFGKVLYKEYDYDRYNKVLTEALREGHKIYSAAYIMSSGKEYFGNKRKHQNHLRLLEMIMDENIIENIQRAKRMQDVFLVLRSLPSIGDFLAYQYTIDINYSNIINFSENDFVVPGPGAKEGIRKCFSNLGSFSEIDIIKYMAENQNKEFDKLGLNFKNLWGRELMLIDIQNLFCEVDKYSRVKHPDIIGKMHRTKIKQKFVPTPEKINYWFPPKWGLNDKVNKSLK